MEKEVHNLTLLVTVFTIAIINLLLLITNKSLMIPHSIHGDLTNSPAQPWGLDNNFDGSRCLDLFCP